MGEETLPDLEARVVDAFRDVRERPVALRAEPFGQVESALADLGERPPDPEPPFGPEVVVERRGDDDAAREVRDAGRRPAALRLDRARDAHDLDLSILQLGEERVQRVEDQLHRPGRESKGAATSTRRFLSARESSRQALRGSLMNAPRTPPGCAFVAVSARGVCDFPGSWVILG